MKYTILLIGLMLSCTAQAKICLLKFIPPTEREDGTPLDPSEISHYLVLDRNLAEVYPSPLTGANTGAVGWFTFGDCPTLEDLRMITVDTDGRQSLLSALIYPPLPPECVQ